LPGLGERVARIAGQVNDTVAAAMRALNLTPPSVASSLERSYRDLLALAGDIAHEKRELSRRLGEVNSKLQHEAGSDSLTGLMNRRAFERFLVIELSRARRSNRALSMLIIDLDHFKEINDSHGHQAGDDVLREASARVSAAVRGGDVVARLGGEEFAVLLPDTPIAGALVLAERIRRDFETVVCATAAGPVRFTASFGAAEHSPDDADEKALVARADALMYAAKRAGRNRVLG
jgi:diguanylate cyclase (GGDEF)-like protein